MAVANYSRAAMLLMAATLALAASVQAGYVGSDWVSGQAHATYYGGTDASGTQGVHTFQRNALSGCLNCGKELSCIAVFPGFVCERGIDWFLDL